MPIQADKHDINGINAHNGKSVAKIKGVDTACESYLLFLYFIDTALCCPRAVNRITEHRLKWKQSRVTVFSKTLSKSLLKQIDTACCNLDVLISEQGRLKKDRKQ